MRDLGQPRRWGASSTLRIATAAWRGAVGLALLLFVAAVPLRYAELVRRSQAVVREQGHLVVDGGVLERALQSRAYPLGVLLLEVIFVVALTTASAAMVKGQLQNPRALLFSAVFTLYGVWVTPTIDVLVGLPGVGPVAALVNAAGLQLAVSFFLLFPDGRFVPRWTRFSALGWGVYNLAWGLDPTWRHAQLDPFEASVPAFLGLLLLGWGLGLLAQAIRFRTADAAQRAQTKWVMLVIAAACVGYGLVYLPDGFLPAGGRTRLLYDLFGGSVFWLVALPIPISLVVAILRHQLFDAQLVVRRTLLYTTLTLALGFVYLGSVFLLQIAFGGLAGGRSSTVTAVSTMASATLFQPLRGRIQGLIDRRFFRSRHDARVTVSRLNARLRDDPDLDSLVAEILTAASQTMQPAQASLWLRPVRARGGG